MSTQDQPLDKLPNIGPTIARRLREVGIRSKRDLQRVGSVGAFRRLRRRHSGKTMSVCYYLYSLEGALTGVHWDGLDAGVKNALRRRAGRA